MTLFCRRDFRRYLRWKRRELASQDDERRKEEKTRYVVGTMTVKLFGLSSTRRWLFASVSVPFCGGS